MRHLVTWVAPDHRLELRHRTVVVVASRVRGRVRVWFGVGCHTPAHAESSGARPTLSASRFRASSWVVPLTTTLRFKETRPCPHQCPSSTQADSCQWVLAGSPSAAHHLPASADAFNGGDLSSSKVRTLTRVATPDNEHELLAIAADLPAPDLPAADLGRALAAWINRTAEPEELDAHQQRRRSITQRVEPDGRRVAHPRPTKSRRPPTAHAQRHRRHADRTGHPRPRRRLHPRQRHPHPRHDRRTNRVKARRRRRARHRHNRTRR